MHLRLLAVPTGLLILACADGGTAPPAAPSDQDVRGVYAVTWSDELTIRLDIGGAVQEVTAGVDEVVTFNAPDGSPLELDLGAYCADPNVLCPSEAWPAEVAINQDNPTVQSDLHTLRAWDALAPAAVVGGAVDHRNDQLLFGLDSASGGSESCAALAISLAGGTFYYPSAPGDTGGDTGADTGADTGVGAGADVLLGGVAAAEGGTTGIVDGRVAVGWLGVCAWSGLAVAATLSVETGYEAVRVRALD
ncbi:MAG: hypothetical protein Q8P18_27640 [Pseudomonadota bacterium]|nr:hypothetical protein [Pseudomonadota bacterium]